MAMVTYTIGDHSKKQTTQDGWWYVAQLDGGLMHKNTFAIITYKPCDDTLSQMRTRRKIYVYTSEQVVMLGTSLSPLLFHIMHIRLICSIKADYARKQFFGDIAVPTIRQRAVVHACEVQNIAMPSWCLSFGVHSNLCWWRHYGNPSAARLKFIRVQNLKIALLIYRAAIGSPPS